MLKKLLKREKGFTLVELLAVIVILGIILAIAVPAIGKVISNSEDNAHKANVELILNAAKLADLANEFDETDGMTPTELETAGYLESVPEIPGTSTSYAGTVTKSGETFTYSPASGEPAVD